MSQAQSDIVNIEDSISQIDQREIDFRKNFKIFVFSGFRVGALSIASLTRKELTRQKYFNHPVVFYFKI